MDVHNYKRRLELSLEHLSEDRTISNNNKDTIVKYKDERISNGVSLARIARQIYDLVKFSRWLNKDFEDAKIEDIKKLVTIIETSDYAEATKSGFKLNLKIFYRWLRNTEEYPLEVKWIKPKIKSNNCKLPDDMLTEEEVKKLIIAANNPRDKALVSVLYESGCRVSEILTLRIKHVTFDEYGAILMVSGKTGMRRVRTIASTPYLQEWINKHTDKNNPDSPLWVKRRGKGNMDYGVARCILDVLKKNSGIKKKVNPHNFRHSRATFLANHLTDAQMKEYFGWTKGSNMASIYVHLSGRDVDNALLKVSGIEINGNGKKESEFKSRKCIRCETVNESTNTFCRKCGMVIDEKTMIGIIEKDSKIQHAGSFLEKMLEDREFAELFERKIKDVIGNG